MTAFLTLAITLAGIVFIDLVVIVALSVWMNDNWWEK